MAKRRPRAKGKKLVPEVGATTPVTSDQAAPTCSFCGKSQRDVRKLIHGPTACICDECVELCQDILATGGEGETTVTQEELALLRRRGPAAALRDIGRTAATRAEAEARPLKEEGMTPTKGEPHGQ